MVDSLQAVIAREMLEKREWVFRRRRRKGQRAVFYRLSGGNQIPKSQLCLDCGNPIDGAYCLLEEEINFVTNYYFHPDCLVKPNH